MSFAEQLRAKGFKASTDPSDGFAYFSVSFHYSPVGRGVAPEENKEARESLFRAEQIVSRAFHDLGWDEVHEYSWPDGSCYKLCRFAATEPPDLDEVKAQLNAKLVHPVEVERIIPRAADYVTHRGDTLMQEFGPRRPNASL